MSEPVPAQLRVAPHPSQLTAELADATWMGRCDMPSSPCPEVASLPGRLVAMRESAHPETAVVFTTEGFEHLIRSAGGDPALLLNPPA